MDVWAEAVPLVTTRVHPVPTLGPVTVPMTQGPSVENSEFSSACVFPQAFKLMHKKKKTQAEKRHTRKNAN